MSEAGPPLIQPAMRNRLLSPDAYENHSVRTVRQNGPRLSRAGDAVASARARPHSPSDSFHPHRAESV